MKSFRFLNFLLMLLLVCCSTIFISCGGDDDDDPTPPTPLESLTVSPITPSLLSKKDSKTDIFITASGDNKWIISGCPEWLHLSSNSGIGNTTVTLTALSDNKSDKERSATLKVSLGSKAVDITVTQANGYAQNCDVKPKVIVALANSFAMDWEYGSNVLHYYSYCLPKSEAQRKSEDEIVESMLKDNYNTPSDGYVTSWKNRNPTTTYVVYTLGFDKDGNRGNLIQTDITTKSGTNQAKATISEVQYDSTEFSWVTTPNAYTTRYFQCYMPDYNSSLNSTTTDAALAWFFKAYMERYPNDPNFAPIATTGHWTRKRNGSNVFFMVTWALDVDGNYSGVIDSFYGTISSSAKASTVSKVSDVNNSSKDVVITHKKDFGL